VAHQRGAVTSSVVLDHHGSTLLRAFDGFDGYRPTLGLAPGLAYQSTATVSFVASTVREQAYLLDRLRAVGVLGDSRFLPHSNPKSLTSFAASPLAPSKVVVLRELRGGDGDHSGPVYHQGGVVSILTTIGVESEIVSLDDLLLGQVARMPFIGGGSQIKETATVDETQAFIARVDRLVGSVDLLMFDLVDGPLFSQNRPVGLWLLAELANLPMVVLAGARIALLGARFDDARLLRMAAFLAGW
jgi:Asp-tRNA(Asn)/Glu-tRNA(Gln) amidotransferase A subunit family amidase